MRRSLLFTLILFVGGYCHVVAERIVIDFAHPKFAQLDEEEKNLLSEYAKAYPKIRDFYENIRMDVTAKTMYSLFDEDLLTLRSSGESQGLNEIEIKDMIERSRQTEKQYEIRYRLPDKYCRVDEKVNHPVTPSVRAKLPPDLLQKDFIQEVGISLFTPAMEYQLSKSDPRKQFFSLNMKRDASKPNVEGITIAVMYFDTAPFCSSGTIPLESILFQCPPIVVGKPHPVVEYMRRKEIGGEHIIEIRLSSSWFPDSAPAGIYTEIRLCNNSWVVKETYTKTFAMSSGKIGWIRSSCTYDGVADGVPLLKTYQRSEGDYDKDTQEEIIRRQMLCEITNLIPGPPDLSEFDVAQFLPPDVHIGETTYPMTFAQLSWGRIAGIVIGVILIILGIYLKMRYRNEH